MPTRFQLLAQLCRALEETPKRKEKTHLIAEFLNKLDESEVSQATLMIIGTIFPENDGRVLDTGWKTMKSVLDKGGQTTLLSESLTIPNVYSVFNRIAEASGQGSRKQKQSLLEGLINRASPMEKEYLVRMIFGEMRIGVNEGNMIEGIAEATHVKPSLVRRTHMLTGDLGLTAKIALTKGEQGLISQKMQLFTPVKPMLAATSYDIKKTLEEHGGISAFEYKLDGARLQIHKQGDTVKLYSRRLAEVTDSLPDVVAMIQKGVTADAAVLEAEAVAIGVKGRPLPFQDLMRRFRRVRNVDETAARIPLRLHIFDLLYLDGVMLLDEPYTERWKKLGNISPQELLVRRMISGIPKEVEGFLQKSVEDGNEGLMAKRLDSRYTPGVRGKKWFKIKHTETLDLVIVAADWGYGRRTGWLSNYHLAAQSRDGYKVVGKTFKGLTDEEFKWMTQRLQELKIRETPGTVHVKPSIVVEVDFNEVQKSSRYESGYALRFARIKNIREDKNPRQADIIDKVAELYQTQFRYKEKLN